MAPARIAPKRTIRLAVATGLTVAALGLGSVSALANPHLQTPGSADTTGSVTDKLATLATASEKLSEQLNAAKLTLANASKAARLADDAATTAAAQAAGAQRALASSLAQQYKAGSFGQTAALFTSGSGQNYLDELQSLSQLSAHQSAIAAQAVAANEQAKSAQSRSAQAVAEATAQERAVQQRQTDLKAQISKYQTTLATLTASARSAYYGSSTPSSAEIAAAVANYSHGASAQDVLAIRAALAQLGKPYVWAAAGPSTFDCSGLTMWAWNAAGVALPHLASSQQGMGTPVDRASLRPGDLVFFGSPAYHVALYMGSGMIIQAPTSGDVVKISLLAGMQDYSSATRLG
ncbi:NlpC/P60 family protein [Jatrophihabitans telluris]|uniref:NlpC/P60 family protein n=1 Tax=Jatrophihabitans telluris TaxID=2038343 RepID=A0ABY4QY03_9ACTN|nr:NlpC/P60 family protein [Jatrophihabitans telluris]UQX88274.1 NlpC/P60 family protein [Jatrophihabitans telluris]